MNDLLSRSVVAEERARQLESEVATLRHHTAWSTDDPRETLVRARIVVLTGDTVTFADVETKHGYCVFVERPGYRQLIDADGKWPGWFWATMPSR